MFANRPMVSRFATNPVRPSLVYLARFNQEASRSMAYRAHQHADVVTGYRFHIASTLNPLPQAGVITRKSVFRHSGNRFSLVNGEDEHD